MGDRDLDVIGPERLGREWCDGEGGPRRRVCITESLLVRRPGSQVRDVLTGHRVPLELEFLLGGHCRWRPGREVSMMRKCGKTGRRGDVVCG